MRAGNTELLELPAHHGLQINGSHRIMPFRVRPFRGSTYHDIMPPRIAFRKRFQDLLPGLKTARADSWSDPDMQIIGVGTVLAPSLEQSGYDVAMCTPPTTVDKAGAPQMSIHDEDGKTIRNQNSHRDAQLIRVQPIGGTQPLFAGVRARAAILSRDTQDCGAVLLVDKSQMRSVDVQTLASVLPGRQHCTLLTALEAEVLGTWVYGIGAGRTEAVLKPGVWCEKPRPFNTHGVSLGESDRELRAGFAI